MEVVNPEQPWISKGWNLFIQHEMWIRVSEIGEADR